MAFILLLISFLPLPLSRIDAVEFAIEAAAELASQKGARIVRNPKQRV